MEYIAFNDFEDFRLPHSKIVDCPYVYAEHFVEDEIRAIVQQSLKSVEDAEKALNAILDYLRGPGVFIELVTVNEHRKDGEWIDYDSVSETGIRREGDLTILESLGLIRHVVLKFEIRKAKKFDFRVSVYYYHLTNFWCLVLRSLFTANVPEIARNRSAP